VLAKLGKRQHNMLQLRSTQMAEVAINQRSGRLQELAAVLAPICAVLGGYLLFGYLRGDSVYLEGSVDTQLEQIIKPQAVSMARFVLKKNKELNNGVLVTNPGTLDGGAYTVRLDGFTPNEWVEVEAEMYKGKNGLLDPSTVNVVDLHIRDYVNDGKDYYGGSKASAQEIKLIYGDSTTFTDGNWGVEDSLYPVGYNDPTIDITTHTKSPQEDAASADAKNAERIARVFSAEAATWVSAINSPENAQHLTAPKPR